MKFTVAAGILAQVLPALSENPPPKLSAQDFSNEHDLAMSQALKSILHGGSARGRDSTNAYQGRQLGGLLNNIPFTNMKACDPSSNDPDIGILSCDDGYECVFDQESAIGGLCTSISRELQEGGEPYRCFLCDYGSIIGGQNFGIVVDILAYEGATCGSLYSAAYVNDTLDASTCGATGLYVKDAGCCTSYNCDLCGEAEFFPDALVQTGPSSTVKCSRFPGAMNETACALYGAIIARSCCGNETEDLASMVPTPVPVATPSVPNSPSPPSSSDSVFMWSTSDIVSMMSVTVGTAGALLW